MIWRARSTAAAAAVLFGACGAAQSPPDASFGPPPQGGSLAGSPCQGHGDCLSRVCAVGPTGIDGARVCQDPAQVLYVGGGGHCSDSGGGITAPLCGLDTALPRLTGEQVIRLLPGTFGPPAAIPPSPAGSQGQVAIYGSDSSEPDWLKGPALIGDKLGLQANVRLTLDAVQVAGVTCSEAELTMLRSTVRGAPGVGLLGEGCDVRVRATTFRDNRDGALWLRGGSYSITASQFTENSSVWNVAVRLSADSVGLQGAALPFTDNAIQDNITMTAGLPGGIDCGPGAEKEIVHTSLCGNSQDSTGSQSSGRCVFISPMPCP